MKVELFVMFFYGLLLVGCTPKDGLAAGKVTSLSKEVLIQTPLPKTHYSVDKSELTDMTVSEEKFKLPSYGNGNGTVLSFSEVDGIKVWKRKFIDTINIETYDFADRQFLYVEPDAKKTICTLSKNDRLKSSEILITTTENPKSTECWLQVVDTLGHEGWVFVGSRDPYLNDNWAIVGSVEVDGKKKLLRKYTSMFSIWGPQVAYDEPSTSGKNLWHPLRTDDNSQINFEAICVTDQTYKGKYFPEHWVKVKDAYGRIGWFPGDTLEVERGGPKYYTPEAVVEDAFYEE